MESSLIIRLAQHPVVFRTASSAVPTAEVALLLEVLAISVVMPAAIAATGRDLALPRMLHSAAEA